MTEKIKMIMPGNPKYIMVTELAVEAAAVQAGFDLEAVNDIKLATGEACKQVICHGFEGWCSCYEVECETDGEKIIIKILESDCGHKVPKKGKICLDCPREGDLSVEIMRTLMDEIEIKKPGSDEEGKKSIIMTKKKSHNK